MDDVINMDADINVKLDDLNETDFMNEMEAIAANGVGSLSEPTKSNTPDVDVIAEEENVEHIDNIEINDSANTNVDNDNISVDEAIENVNNEINDENDVVESVDNVEQLSQEEIEEFHLMKSQFAKLDQEFTVDGRKVQGLTDPEHILNLQKAYYQLKDNKSGLDEVAPVYDALKESGLLSDHSKLTMLLEAANGSPEAIKMLLKQNDIDPMELDTESIDEESVLDSQSKYVASKDELSLKDFYSKATSLGKGDFVMGNIIEAWDSDSLRSLVQDPEASSIVINHLEDGSFDKIMDEVAKIKMTDFDSVFSNKSSYEQYVAANHSLYDRITEENRVESERLEHERNVSIQKKAVAESTPAPVIKEDDDSLRISQALNASKQSKPIGSSSVSSSGTNSIDDMSNDEVVNFFESFITN
jgi:hypothetical protein